MALTTLKLNGLDDSAITSAKIANNAVTTSKINTSAVTSAKILDNAVTSAKIADSAVTSTKILNDAVTAGKINADAVTSDKIANNTITNSDVNASAAIAASKVTGVTGSVSGASDGTVSSSDPATDTNPSAVGHLWVNSTSGEVFIATDVTTDSNVWTNIGEGTGGVAPVVWYGDRGLMAGSHVSGVLDINYFNIPTTGNAADFGDLVGPYIRQQAAVSNGSRGCWMGGRGAARYDRIDYVTISTLGNALDFGNITSARSGGGGCSDGTKGVLAGGNFSGSDIKNIIDYITIATTGNSTDFGDLVSQRYNVVGLSNDVRGIFAGGWTGSASSNIMEYITIATTGNSTDFGDLLSPLFEGGACGSKTRGIFAGGDTGSVTNVIQYVTIASTGNATDFGDLTVARQLVESACSNNTRAVFGSDVDVTLDYITIDTTGNATDFGDTTSSNIYQAGATSGD